MEDLLMTSAAKETIASMTVEELTALIDDRARHLIQQQQKGDPFLGGLVKEEILNKPYDASAKPFWEVALEISQSIPDEIWAEIPTDASINVDHYLYGAPKVEE
jgi:hypothetical protein